MDAQTAEKLIFGLNKIKVNLIKSKQLTADSLEKWLETTAIPYCDRQIKGLKESRDYKYSESVGRVLNSLQSLLEGVKSGEAGSEAALEVSKDVHLSAVYIENLFEKQQRKKNVETQKDLQDGTLDKVDSADPTIQKYKIYAEDLPLSLSKKNFVVLRMPVIPIADPAFNFAKLKALKLAEDRIAEYVILPNQAVLGININWIDEEFRNKSDKALEYVIDMMKMKFKKNFHPTGGAVHLHKVVWWWIPNSDELGRLSLASVGGRLSVHKWGFAFNV